MKEMSIESKYISRPTPPDKIKRMMSVFFGYKGKKTITRASLNMKAESLNLNGRILDLGAGGERQYSYYELLRFKGDSQVIAVDINRDRHPHVVADLERNLPFKSGSIGYVLMFNLLEHIYDFSGLCSEAYRVLQTGGILYMFVPFLCHLHEDPCDYFRYTGHSLQRLLKESGFDKIVVENLGSGPLTTAYFLFSLIWPVLLKRVWWPALFIAISADRLINYIRRRLNRPFSESSYRLPFSYFVTGVKGNMHES